MALLTTDIIILALLILCFQHGWKRGFIQSLIGPSSFLLCLIIGILYFDLSQNIFKALLITGLSTVCLSVIINILLFISQSTIDKNHRKYISSLSRILGAATSVIYNGAIIGIFLLMIIFFPLHFSELEKIQNNIHQSQTYHWIMNYFIPNVPQAKKTLLVLNVFKDPKALEGIIETREYQDFISDPKITKILDDETIKDQIKNKNFQQLVYNPKIKEILSDEALMRKFTKLSKRIYYENAVGDEEEKPLTSDNNKEGGQ